jgi:hypothetical protein
VISPDGRLKNFRSEAIRWAELLLCTIAIIGAEKCLSRIFCAMQQKIFCDWISEAWLRHE